MLKHSRHIEQLGIAPEDGVQAQEHYEHAIGWHRC